MKSSGVIQRMGRHPTHSGDFSGNVVIYFSWRPKTQPTCPDLAHLGLVSLVELTPPHSSGSALERVHTRAVCVSRTFPISSFGIRSASPLPLLSFITSRMLPSKDRDRPYEQRRCKSCDLQDLRTMIGPIYSSGVLNSHCLDLSNPGQSD